MAWSLPVVLWWLGWEMLAVIKLLFISDGEPKWCMMYKESLEPYDLYMESNLGAILTKGGVI